MGLKRMARDTLQAIVTPYGWELRRVRGSYQSETSRCRARLAGYCQGNGVDLGPGGDPINEAAVRIDLPNPYSSAGLLPVQLAGDATNLYWFKDAVLDYVFSSHLLEDFEDTKPILIEWLRVLRPGGNLVIFCPDEQVYRQHCKATGQNYNIHHKIENFSLSYVKSVLAEISVTKVVHECPLIDTYSWEIVAQKL